MPACWVGTNGDLTGYIALADFVCCQKPVYDTHTTHTHNPGTEYLGCFICAVNNTWLSFIDQKKLSYYRQFYACERLSYFAIADITLHLCLASDVHCEISNTNRSLEIMFLNFMSFWRWLLAVCTSWSKSFSRRTYVRCCVVTKLFRIIATCNVVCANNVSAVSVFPSYK